MDKPCALTCATGPHLYLSFPCLSSNLRHSNERENELACCMGVISCKSSRPIPASDYTPSVKLHDDEPSKHNHDGYIEKLQYFKYPSCSEHIRLLNVHHTAHQVRIFHLAETDPLANDVDVTLPGCCSSLWKGNSGVCSYNIRKQFSIRWVGHAMETVVTSLLCFRIVSDSGITNVLTFCIEPHSILRGLACMALVFYDHECCGVLFEQIRDTRHALSFLIKQGVIDG
ncbi:hypothetical protein VNO77_31666 [Canavalia gladiata]|uniref:Uncharacterized protein n=1 Tax=Canavalia gladiata TaxID=3824 RepID=A0AAN9Q3S7_CANGL